MKAPQSHNGHDGEETNDDTTQDDLTTTTADGGPRVTQQMLKQEGNTTLSGEYRNRRRKPTGWHTLGSNASRRNSLFSYWPISAPHSQPAFIGLTRKSCKHNARNESIEKVLPNSASKEFF